MRAAKAFRPRCMPGRRRQRWLRVQSPSIRSISQGFSVMLSRASAVASCLSLAALLAAGQSIALELPLPPEGEDVVGQIRVIKAKYEDTFAAIAETNDLGYSELVAA